MSKLFTVILIIFLVVLGDMSTDIFTPALPLISADFAVEEATAQFTISANLIGLAISGLIYGIFADIYGRRPLILLGLIIFIIASVLAFFANSINYLIACRLLQGMGEGAMTVLGYACVRDLYSGPQFIKIISRLNMVLCVSPIVAPVLGGLILTYGGSWYSLFGFLGTSAAITLLTFFFYFEETLTKRLEIRFTAKEFFKSYFQILKTKQFLAFSLIVVLSYGWLWSYITSLPFLYIQQMNVPIKYYGIYICIRVLAYILGTFLNQAYVEQVGPKKLLLIGLILAISTDSFLIVLHYLIRLTPLITELVSIPGSIGLALIINNGVMYALEHIPKDSIARGSAIIRFLELAFSAVIIYIAGSIYNGTIVPLSAITVINGSISLLIFVIIFYRGNKYKLSYNK